MAQECPLRCAEEWMRLYIRGTGAGTKATELIFDEEFANERLAKTRGLLVSLVY